jgi:hypothetical protein
MLTSFVPFLTRAIPFQRASFRLTNVTLFNVCHSVLTIVIPNQVRDPLSLSHPAVAPSAFMRKKERFSAPEPASPMAMRFSAGGGSFFFTSPRDSSGPKLIEQLRR